MRLSNKNNNLKTDSKINQPFINIRNKIKVFISIEKLYDYDPHTEGFLVRIDKNLNYYEQNEDEIKIANNRNTMGISRVYNNESPKAVKPSSAININNDLLNNLNNSNNLNDSLSMIKPSNFNYENPNSNTNNNNNNNFKINESLEIINNLKPKTSFNSLMEAFEFNTNFNDRLNDKVNDRYERNNNDNIILSKKFSSNENGINSNSISLQHNPSNTFTGFGSINPNQSRAVAKKTTLKLETNNSSESFGSSNNNKNLRKSSDNNIDLNNSLQKSLGSPPSPSSPVRSLSSPNKNVNVLNLNNMNNMKSPVIDYSSPDSFDSPKKFVMKTDKDRQLSTSDINLIDGNICNIIINF